MGARLTGAVVGVIFGVTLSWTGMSSPDVIREALLFENAYLFLFFGIGWGVSDACPGPIATQLGQGVWWSLFTIAGLATGITVHLRRQRRPTPGRFVRKSKADPAKPAFGSSNP